MVCWKSTFQDLFTLSGPKIYAEFFDMLLNDWIVKRSYLIPLTKFINFYRIFRSVNFLLNSLSGIVCLNISSFHLTHFTPIFHFYTPWKSQRTIGFRVYRNEIMARNRLKSGKKPLHSLDFFPIPTAQKMMFSIKDLFGKCD